MGLPGKKLTKSSKKRRASHFALSQITLGQCPKCKKPVLPHHVCQFCGTYAGRVVLKIESKLDKKKKGKREEKSAKAREDKASKKEESKKNIKE